MQFWAHTKLLEVLRASNAQQLIDCGADDWKGNKSYNNMYLMSVLCNVFGKYLLDFVALVNQDFNSLVR